MRMYAQLDVEWPGNRKRLRAGLEASAIHAITLCLAKRSSRDGWVAKDELSLYGATDDHLDRLVDVGLLDEDDEWVRPHDWLEVNLSSERIRAEKADKARAANHARWQHEGPFDSCPICHKPRSSEADPDGLPADPPESLKRSEEQPDTEEQRQPQTTDPDGRRALLEAAADIIGQRAASRPTTVNPDATRRSVAAAVKRDRYEDVYKAITRNPSITAEELAEHLEPTSSGAPEPFNPASVLPTVDDLFKDRPDANPEANLAGISEARLALHPTREPEHA